MKKPRLLRRSRSKGIYHCRLCERDDFRTAMEYTNHLGRCKGPKVKPVAVTPPGTCEKCQRANHAIEKILADLKRVADDLRRHS